MGLHPKQKCPQNNKPPCECSGSHCNEHATALLNQKTMLPGKADYCSEQEDADYRCYKAGYPRCCLHPKQKCPQNNKPPCECSGSHCNEHATALLNQKTMLPGKADYCSKEEDADYRCYKAGYPRCCLHPKQKCPQNNKPPCECSGGHCNEHATALLNQNTTLQVASAK